MKQPTPHIPEHICLPAASIHTLKNGIDIHVIRAEEYNVLRFTFVFRAGSAHQHAPFSASTTANLLGEGSKNLTGAEISEQLDFYGSNFEVNLDRDFVYVTFNCLSKFASQTLDLARQILLESTFPEHELRTYADKRKQALAIERLKVDTRAREAFATALFGAAHPYGVSYPEGAYDTLRRQDVTELYDRLYTASNALVVCSGAVGTTELKGISELAEALPAGSRSEVAFPAPYSTPRTFVATDRAVQSSIRVGRRLFGRTHPDFVPMQVLATLLGGYFGSRLMRTLREQRGYTYGVGAAMVNFEAEGYLGISTQVGAEVMVPALEEIYRQIGELRDRPVSTEELRMVQNILAGEMLRILDGPFGIADITIENLLCGMDNTAVEAALQTIRTVTPEQLQALAQKYLRPDDLTEVVAGAKNPR